MYTEGELVKVKISTALKGLVGVVALPIYLVGVPVTFVLRGGRFSQRVATALLWPMLFIPLHVSSERTIGGFDNPWLLKVNRWLDAVMTRRSSSQGDARV